VPLTDLTDTKIGGSAQLRNEPVQARSTARLTALLDAAAAAVHELGYERITTAMVAERAGASIGTVYRYFPDRIAVLQALASRNLERVLAGIQQAFTDESNASWTAALDAGFDVYVNSFRTEPGFASLRSGDVIDLRPATSPVTQNSHIADVMVDALVQRFAIEDSSATRTAVETAVEVMDALVARAFARDAHGDADILTRARALVTSIIADQIA
jgi:AcrR family transcriptional regulator